MSFIPDMDCTKYLYGLKDLKMLWDLRKDIPKEILERLQNRLQEKPKDYKRLKI